MTNEIANAFCRIASAIETFAHAIDHLAQVNEWNSRYNQAQRDFEKSRESHPEPERQWIKSPESDNSPVLEKLGDKILGQVLAEPSVILPKKKHRSKKCDDHVEDAKVYSSANAKYPDNRFFIPEKSRYNFTPQDDEEISRLFRKGFNAREISEALFVTPDKQAGVSWRITNKLHLKRPEKKRGK